MQKLQVCTNWRYARNGKSSGRFIIKLILSTFIFPGLLYTIWRASKKDQRGPQYKSNTMISANTLRGRKLLTISMEPKGRIKLSIACILCSTLIASCSATPAGKLTEKDFYSKTINVTYNADKAAHKFLEGLRYCGHETGAVFGVVHHGKPNCLPPTSSGKITCDLYMDLGNAGNKYVSGRVAFNPNKKGTEVTIGAINRFSKKDDMINAWEKFIHGEAKDVCP